jgi:hypothetical protein
MKHEEARLLLNDYIDGLLADQRRSAVEHHLKDCPRCRQEVAQLRALMARATKLPDSLEPGRDLWPGIAAAISGRSQESPSAEAAAGGRAASGKRRFGTSLRRWLRPAGRDWAGIARPAFAAAAILVLVLLTVIVIHVPRRSGLVADGQGPLAGDAPDAETVAVLAALEAECAAADDETAAFLPQGAEESKESEESAESKESEKMSILELIAHNLRIIDLAISDAREAWSADPHSPHLARILASAYRAKAALQGQRTELAARL